MFRPINSREKERQQYNVPRSMPSTMPYPIVKNHDLYTFDKGAIDRQAQLTRQKNRESTFNRQNPRTMQFPVQQNQQRFMDRNAFQKQLSSQGPVVNEGRVSNGISHGRMPVVNEGRVSNGISHGRMPVVNEGRVPVQNFKYKNNNLNYRFQNYHSFNNSEDVNKFLDRQPVNSRMDLYETRRADDDDEFKKIQGGVFKTITSQQRPQQAREQKKVIRPQYIPNTRNMGIPKTAL
jgi:hypothetical protein